VLPTNFRHNLLNFLAQRLSRWADFLRAKSQAPNSKINSAEQPENLLLHEDWLQRTKSKPPPDWLERVVRSAPELLLNMPEFIVQTAESYEKEKTIETAETETPLNQISDSKNIAATDRAQKVQLIKKLQTNLPLQSFASKIDSKPFFSPLKFFKFEKEASQQVESARENSTESVDSTKLTRENASQTNSNFIRNAPLRHEAQQTSIIRFNRREPKTINKLNLTNSKPDKNLAKNLLLQQIIESRRSSEPTKDHKQIEVEQKNTLAVSQQQVFRSEFKIEANESRETNTNKIETDVNNFVLPKQNRINDQETIASSLVDKKSQAKPNNLFPEKTVKIATPKFPAETLQPQKNLWADLPSLAETFAEIFDEFEVCSQKDKHLRGITFEQTGGGWNE
jgi:hypothetical protein